MTNETRIVRIVSVVDTRDFEETVGKNGRDRWTPIPGSGDLRSCDRCGREHEIHATVELSDGSFSVVGTGCMKAESAEILDRLRSQASRATRIAKLEAGLVRARENVAKASAAFLASEQMTAPEVTVEPDPKRRPGSTIYRCGDACAWADPGQDRSEYVLQSWRTNRYRDAVGGAYKMPERFRDEVAYLERRLLALRESADKALRGA